MVAINPGRPCHLRLLGQCERSQHDRHLYLMFDSYSLLTLAPLVRERFEVKNLIAGQAAFWGWAIIFGVPPRAVLFASSGAASRGGGTYRTSGASSGSSERPIPPRNRWSSSKR